MTSTKYASLNTGNRLPPHGTHDWVFNGNAQQNTGTQRANTVSSLSFREAVYTPYTPNDMKFTAAVVLLLLTGVIIGEWRKDIE